MMTKQAERQNLEKEILNHKAFLERHKETLHPFQKGVIERAIENLGMEIEND
jgi:hypothetical protein